MLAYRCDAKTNMNRDSVENENEKENAHEHPPHHTQHVIIILCHPPTLTATPTMSDTDNNDRQSAVLSELYQYCNSDLLSEEGLRKIFERYGMTPNNALVSDYGFFLVACNNKRVSEGIIRLLLEYFPAAARLGWLFG